MSSAPHVDDFLIEHALGTLDTNERSLVDSHLIGCPRCAAEKARTAEVLTGLAQALTPAAPAPGVRARLLARARGRCRFAPFSDRVAALFDLAREKAEALLETLEDPACWV